MKILNATQIKQKTNRLAIEILEQNFKEKEIILAGINNNGMNFAKMLEKRLSKRSDLVVTLCQIRLNPAKPIASPITLDLEEKQLNKKVVIVVDDVANTGRTIFYAFLPFMKILPKKVEVAVLVDRMHKSFPVKPDYVGLSLATTAKENIEVNLNSNKDAEVLLS